MIVNYCDICGCDTAEKNFENLYGSRKIIVMLQEINRVDMRSSSIVLCNDCKKNMYYLVSNPDVLKKNISDMRISNRIRYLFKKKIRKEESDTEVI